MKKYHVYFNNNIMTTKIPNYFYNSPLLNKSLILFGIFYIKFVESPIKFAVPFIISLLLFASFSGIIGVKGLSVGLPNGLKNFSLGFNNLLSIRSYGILSLFLTS